MITALHDLPVVAAPAQDWLRVLGLYALGLINAERGRRRLRPLAWDEDVARVARGYSAAQAHAGRISHQDARGMGPADRVMACGVRFSAIGENLSLLAPLESVTRHHVADMHRGLMASPGHRENILRLEFTTGAAGIAMWRGTAVMTQLFARP